MTSPNTIIADLVAEIEDLKKQVASKQAEIDGLMLEYCPGDMTTEQIEEWCRHQHPVDFPKFDL